MAGLAVNVGANIGFNAIWASVMGPADRRPTPEDVEKMRGMVLRGLEQGAYGVSAGLDYKPGYYATAEEVGRVIDVARPWRTNFPNHDRLTPESNYSSRVGVAETIAIAGRSGLVPIVTHMKAQGREQGTAPALLADDERGDGARAPTPRRTCTRTWPARAGWPRCSFRAGRSTAAATRC